MKLHLFLCQLNLRSAEEPTREERKSIPPLHFIGILLFTQLMGHKLYFEASEI